MATGANCALREVDIEELVVTVAKRIIGASDELTELDAAIGDGDHGLNMTRGFKAVVAEKQALANMSLPQAIQHIGHTLLMNVGGASGPLYGTLFRKFGAELPYNSDLQSCAKAFSSATLALQQLGKVERTSKTMFDVIAPISDSLFSGETTFQTLRHVATESAKSTIGMKALRGRAAYLGERSVGHMDPGARSAEIIVLAVCDVLEATHAG